MTEPNEPGPGGVDLRPLDRSGAAVTDHLERFKFNTAIAAMMELTNHLTGLAVRPRGVLQTLVLLLSPFAPHIAEELWSKLHSSPATRHSSLSYAPWPKFDPALLVEDTLELLTQGVA